MSRIFRICRRTVIAEVIEQQSLKLTQQKQSDYRKAATAAGFNIDNRGEVNERFINLSS